MIYTRNSIVYNGGMDGEAGIDNRIFKRNSVEHTAVQVEYTGEEPIVRGFDYKSPEDMVNWIAINDNLPSQDFTKPSDENPHKKGMLIAEAKFNQPGRPGAFAYDFALSYPQNYKEPELRNQAFGWVSVYPDEDRKKIKQYGFIPKNHMDRDIIEVVLGKKADAPNGLMAKGLRRVLTNMMIIDSALYPEKSEPQFVFTAYINPDRANAMEFAKSCGFEDKGAVHFRPDKYHLFVLNWQKLTDLTQQYPKLIPPEKV